MFLDRWTKPRCRSTNTFFQWRHRQFERKFLRIARWSADFQLRGPGTVYCAGHNGEIKFQKVSTSLRIIDKFVRSAFCSMLHRSSDFWDPVSPGLSTARSTILPIPTPRWKKFSSSILSSSTPITVTAVSSLHLNCFVAQYHIMRVFTRGFAWSPQVGSTRRSASKSCVLLFCWFLSSESSVNLNPR